MNRGELREYVRVVTDDVGQQYRVTDALLNEFINEAQTEAAIRGRLLFDEQFTYPIVAGTATYYLDDCVLGIYSAHTVTTPRQLDYVDADYMDCHYGAGWRDETGDPSSYLTNIETGVLQLYPIPTTADTLRLRAWRLPTSMATDTSTPEIRGEHHRHLADWAIWRALSIRDADEYDPRLAAQHLTQFENHFGRKPSALVQRIRQNGGGQIIPQANYRTGYR